jgi:hypothetical protein
MGSIGCPETSVRNYAVITQRVVVFSYVGFLTPKDGIDRLSRNVGKKLRSNYAASIGIFLPWIFDP